MIPLAERISFSLSEKYSPPLSVRRVLMGVLFCFRSAIMSVITLLASDLYLIGTIQDLWLKSSKKEMKYSAPPMDRQGMGPQISL